MADAGDSYEGVIRWLSKAGLSRYVPRFLAEKVTDEAFKNLQVEDYARVGIDAAADKHKLTKLIRQLNPQAPRVSTSRGASRAGAGRWAQDRRWAAPQVGRPNAPPGAARTGCDPSRRLTVSSHGVWCR